MRGGMVTAPPKGIVHFVARKALVEPANRTFTKQTDARGHW